MYLLWSNTFLIGTVVTGIHYFSEITRGIQLHNKNYFNMIF